MAPTPPTPPGTPTPDPDRFAAVPPVEYPPNTSEGIEVMGRFLREPRVRVVVHGERFVLQIDDEQNPEQWIHVYIHEDIVGQWNRFSGLRNDID